MVDVYQKAVDSYKFIFGSLNLSNFDERMQFQKTIYLYKFLGFDFSGLKFGWYRRGPYSFDLVGIKFRVLNSTNTLTSSEKEWLTRHKKMIQELMTNPNDAELYSSIAYLQKEENLDKNQIIERMQLVKPWFTREQVEKGMERVGTVGA